jgi:ketosteroid isomerase-like protein
METDASPSRHRAAVLAYVEAFNRGDLDGVCAAFAPDAEIRGVLGWGSVADARPVWRDLIDALAMQLEVQQLVEQGDSVAVCYLERGSAVRPFRGRPATQRRYEVVAMEFFTFRDGLILRRWGARDFAAIASQLGWTP